MVLPLVFCLVCLFSAVDFASLVGAVPRPHGGSSFDPEHNSAVLDEVEDDIS
jgi:hypothetical protein